LTGEAYLHQYLRSPEGHKDPGVEGAHNLRQGVITFKNKFFIRQDRAAVKSLLNRRLNLFLEHG
jgi:hypothetical protein